MSTLGRNFGGNCMRISAGLLTTGIRKSRRSMSLGNHPLCRRYAFESLNRDTAWFIDTLNKDKVTGRWLRTGPAELLVSPASAICGRSWESGSDSRLSLNANHSDMVKLTEHDRDSHDKVCRVLEGYVGAACPIIKLRLGGYIGLPYQNGSN